MHENEISGKVIGAAIEVHKELGPGLLESVYELALCHELHLRNIPFVRQKNITIRYKGIKLGTNLRLDLLVCDKVIVDLKAKEFLSPTDKPSLLTYLRLMDKRLGLIINFHREYLKDGIDRVVNDLIEPDEFM
ncbi:MAG: GxxExxY protein [Calditrichaeota bacterium]|nr:MAG: GxxExxY protein [Calditrichota bacterium]